MTNESRAARVHWPRFSELSVGIKIASVVSSLLFACSDREPGNVDAATAGQVASPLVSSTFPLKISTDARYLLSADDKPWRLQSEFAWLLAVKATPADMDTYLADRKAKGFNAFTVMSLVRPGGTFGWPDGNLSGQRPFLVTNDLSTPNDAYFDNVDLLIDKAAAQGFAALVFYTYAGFDGGAEGWYQVVAQPQNTQSVCYDFGRYLANRWKNKPNIALMAGGDYTMPAGETRDRMHEIHRGLRDGGCTQLGGSEWGYPDTLLTDQPGYSYGVQADLNLNSWYGQGPSSTGRTYETADRAWRNSPTLPSYMEEPMQGYGHYQILDSSRSAIRRYQHWAVLAGSTAGTNWGLFELANQFVDGQWQQQLSDVMAQDQARAFSLYDSLPWWTMRPSGTGVDYAGRNLIVSQNPRDDSFIAASASNDGKWLLAYLPSTGSSQRSFAVDLRGMAGSSRARFWNPTNGNFVDVTAGSYTLPNSAAAQSFTTPGDNGTQTNDWMLVVDSDGSASPPPTFTMGETNVLSVDDSGNGNLLLAQAVQLSQAGTVTSFSFHVRSAAGQLRLGLYDASGPGGGPGLKRAESVELTPAVGWNTAPAASPVALAPGSYWLAYLPSDSNLHFSGVASGNGRYYSRAYGALPASYATSPTSVGWHWSLYATLSSGSPPTGNAAPTLTTPAAASPNPSTGISTQLSVAATDDAGEGGLIYTWSPAAALPGNVSFSANASNAAKATIATFDHAGDYPLKVAVTDAAGAGVEGALTVHVTSTVSSVTVSPSSASVSVGNALQFSAASADQFGVPVASSVAWTTTGGGTIDAFGLLSADTVGGPFVVTATGSGRSGSASLTVTAAGDVYLGESQILGVDDTGHANLLVAQQAALARAATLKTLALYVTRARGRLRLGVYDSTGPAGGPGRKLAETPDFAAVNGWNSVAVGAPVALPAGNYWLAYVANRDGVHFRRGGTGSGAAKSYNFAFGPLPSTFSSTAAARQDHWSIFGSSTP